MAQDAPDNIVTLEYQFKLRGDLRRSFRVRLRRSDLRRIDPPAAAPADWTRLTHCQCPNCPLEAARHPDCPVAVSLADVIETFRDCLSTEKAEVWIAGPSREYSKRTTVQSGISSLMGLLMTTSGCPVLDRLRPLVQVHLPFATIEETIYRMVSTYLLAQYFIRQRGGEPDWDLHGLVRLCEAIGEVNQAFSRRLISINPQDASLNALANLDCFQLSVALSIDRDRLKEMEPLFEPYLASLS